MLIIQVMHVEHLMDEPSAMYAEKLQMVYLMWTFSSSDTAAAVQCVILGLFQLIIILLYLTCCTR